MFVTRVSSSDISVGGRMVAVCPYCLLVLIVSYYLSLGFRVQGLGNSISIRSFIFSRNKLYMNWCQ